MKPLFTILFICAVYKFCIAQECWSLDQGWIPCSTSDTVVDKRTGNYYVVTRSERCIRAFDQHKKIVWENSPWENKALLQITQSGWDSPGNLDSISIRAIDFPKTEYMGGKEAIVIILATGLLAR